MMPSLVKGGWIFPCTPIHSASGVFTLPCTCFRWLVSIMLHASHFFWALLTLRILMDFGYESEAFRYQVTSASNEKIDDGCVMEHTVTVSSYRFP